MLRDSATTNLLPLINTLELDSFGYKNITKIYIATLVKNIIEKLKKPENYQKIIAKYKWDLDKTKILQEVESSNTWKQFKPPLGNNSLIETVENSQGELEIRDLDIEELNRKIEAANEGDNEISSKYIISYINNIIQESETNETFIIIPKPDNLVQSCCPYLSKISYLQNLLNQYPEFQELINKITLQHDNYKINCTTLTRYDYTNPLKAIGNLNDYYILDEEINNLHQISENRDVIFNSLKFKIIDIYLTFSFEEGIFGKKRIYKDLVLPEIYNNPSFWKQESEGESDLLDDIKTKIEDIISNKQHYASTIKDITTLDEEALKQLLETASIGSGGILERDLLSNKFKIELKTEITEFLNHKTLSELNDLLLDMNNQVYKNNTLKDNEGKIAIIPNTLKNTIITVKNQTNILVNCIEHIIGGLTRNFNIDLDRITGPFSMLKDRYSNISDILNPNIINEIWRESTIPQSEITIPQFITTLKMEIMSIYEKLNLLDISALFRPTKNPITYKINRLIELLDKTTLYMKSEHLYKIKDIDNAKTKITIELKKHTDINAFLNDNTQYADENSDLNIIIKILKDNIREHYLSETINLLKSFIYQFYYNIDFDKNNWNIFSEGIFIVDGLPIYNSSELDNQSIFTQLEGMQFIEMIFILNIYLYLMSNDEDVILLANNLHDGLFKNIIVKNEMTNLTEKEMLEYAVLRNLKKQASRIKKTDNMDSDERANYDLFRQHNLGEFHSSKNEEQLYNEGGNTSNINQDTEPNREDEDANEELDMGNDNAEEPED